MIKICLIGGIYMTFACVISLGILLLVLILFTVGQKRFPLAAVAMMGAALMAVFGILEPGEVFTGFSSPAVLYIIGMSVITRAVIDTGYINKLRDVISDNKKLTEKRLIILCVLLFAAVSSLFQGILIMLMIFPLISLMEKETAGKISRKHMYMPIAFAALYGGNFSIIGSSSMLNAVDQARNYTGEAVHILAPFKLGAAGVIALVLFYFTIGYSFQKKVFDFEPSEIKNSESEKNGCSKDLPIWKKIFIFADFILCIAAACFGIDVGFSAMIGAVALMVMQCVDMKRGLDSIDWPVIFTVVGCLAIGKGIEKSGAGDFIAEKMLSAAEVLNFDTPYLMCVLMLVMATLLSNFMSNNAAVVITVPIAMSIATFYQADPIIYAITCGVGANLSCATPLATTLMTITTSAGYRIKDYLFVGGFVNLLGVIAVSIALKIFYF